MVRLEAGASSACSPTPHGLARPAWHQWPGGQPVDTLEQQLAGPPGVDATSRLLCYLPLLDGRHPTELTDESLREAGIRAAFHRRRIC